MLMERVNQLVLQLDFENTKDEILDLLIEISKDAPIEEILQPGLLQSLFFVFLGREELTEKTCTLLTNLFIERDDMSKYIDDLVETLVIGINSHPSPQPVLLSFFIALFDKFLLSFVNRCTFALDDEYQLQLMHAFKRVIENPFESYNKAYWELFNKILTMCDEKGKVYCFFAPLLTQIRVSIMWSYKSSSEHSIARDTVEKLEKVITFSSPYLSS